MQISVNNPQLQTIIFGFIFILSLMLSARKPADKAFFGIPKTEELKGFAILAIIFSHIGYFLSVDRTFLWPFSILAGVGVNLFLFLSGFGLTLSSLRKPLSVVDFYRKRLVKLFIPMWLVITLFIVMDLVILNRTYPLETIIQSFLGFFPRADLFLDLNSPLWYFSLIFFYYLTFPLFFWKKFPYLCPILLLLLSYYLLQQPLPINKDVINLYKVHSVSFPLGVLFAILVSHQSVETLKHGFKRIFLLSNLKYILIPVFMVIFGYTSIHSRAGLDKDIEQATSLITMFSIIFLFIAKPWEFKLLNLFGIFSYEIYLIHWPILSRYDVLYKYLPASVATTLYLGLFLGLGYLLNKLTRKYT